MASSLEGNKLVAGVLLGCLLASAAGVTSRLVYAPHALEENVYVVELPDSDATAENEPVTPLPVLLASASVEDGAGVVRKCQSCHSFEPGGANGVGPALYGVMGGDIAAVAGYAYSEALTGIDGDWTFEALDGFLANPGAWAPGTKMSFAGLRRPEERADMLLYMNSITETPLALPEVVEEAPAEGEEAPAEGETNEG